jgi:hypothetical protein
MSTVLLPGKGKAAEDFWAGDASAASQEFISPAGQQLLVIHEQAKT